ncbi:hypothetical protein Taro_024466 [Colocasia esculenta]|uniref:Uncharacterized protein n=1 Tax=Colocasia esculenta TaxID=4460 RepID=A0A843VDR4_COLES|nr:hypothetical protein [Colocasia esculenta]
MSEEIGHIQAELMCSQEQTYHIMSSRTYHVKQEAHYHNLACQLCYANHQESILPRLTSTLGHSSPGPDRALIAQALDQVLDRSPTLCRTNKFMLWPQSFNSKLVCRHTLTGVDTMPQTQGKIMQNWSSSVDTSSGSVDTVLQIQGKKVVSTLEAAPRTTFWPIWDSVSTLAQVVSTLETFPDHLLGCFGTVCRH